MGRSRTIELLRDVDDLPADDRQFVAALERGLRVLRVFSSAHETLSNGELARGTGVVRKEATDLDGQRSLVGEHAAVGRPIQRGDPPRLARPETLQDQSAPLFAEDFTRGDQVNAKL